MGPAVREATAEQLSVTEALWETLAPHCPSVLLTVKLAGQLIAGASLFTKVYFPRLIIPLVPIVSKLVDFSISFILLIILMFYYQFYPTPKLFLLPLFMAILIIATSGLGFWFSSMAIQYRDVKFGLSFATPLLMYMAPVVFPEGLIDVVHPRARLPCKGEC